MSFFVMVILGAPCSERGLKIESHTQSPAVQVYPATCGG